MNISKKSWHYRWMTAIIGTRVEEAQTLCQYFWKFVFINFLVSIVLILGSVMVLWLPVSLYSWLHNGSESAKAAFMAYSVIVSGVIVIPTVVVGILKAWEKLTNASEKNNNSFLKVFVEYIRAVKNKVCPFIDYED